MVAAGSDADLVVWDPAQPSTITLESINDGLDWSPYEGFETPGTIRHVFARGDHVVSDARWQGDDHAGSYLPVGRIATPSGPSQS